MADELPREELLRKMLNMTTSDNDGQALVAIRKANKLLSDAGWSWDKLLAGKIKIVESPFKNMPNPTKPQNFAQAVAPDWTTQPLRPTHPQTKAPKPSDSPGLGRIWEYDGFTNSWDAVSDPAVAQKQRADALRAQAQPQRKGLGLSRSNMYANHCYCCGDYTPNNAGFIMKPQDFNLRGADKWVIVCAPCNKSRTPDKYGVPEKPAPRNTGQTTVNAPAPNLGNL